MNRIIILFVLVSMLGCGNTGYQFERVDGGQAIATNLKFDGIYGKRDGANVNAEARFTDGADQVTMDILVYLRPPAEFQSGSYTANIGGEMTSGGVDCPSLTFQGGQTALPTVGGTFILKDEQNRPRYRVRIPATTLSAVPRR